MTPEEALDEIESAVDQTDVFDEHFEIIREALKELEDCASNPYAN